MIIELSSRPFLKRACEESYTKQQISHEKMGHSISAEGKIMIVVLRWSNKMYSKQGPAGQRWVLGHS